MAYGLRYNLKQALRDESLLNVNIYKDSYSGSVYNYTPTSVTIAPNTISDEPEPGIISSQLNLSFILSNQEDYNNFPNLLSFNDKEFYVEVVKTPQVGSSTVIWKGYMFSDYIDVPFTTGNQEVNFTFIDALSFMSNLTYPYPDNINTTIKLKTVLLTGLNWIGYPNLGDLVSTCSYFGSDMDDRADFVGNEPFEQTYIYKRDLIGRNLYDIIDQIMKSFNCRLFQFQGDWWIMSANEMAKSTIYYSKYNATTNNLIASGTIENGVTIAPYAINNVHFIDNSQNKVIRKGYPIIKVETKVGPGGNYTHNSNFKQGTTFPTGFTFGASNGATVTWIQNAGQEYNVVRLEGKTGIAVLLNEEEYAAFMYPTSFKLSFDAINYNNTVGPLYIQVAINNYDDPIFYLQPDNSWAFTQPGAGIQVDYTNKDFTFQQFSREIVLGEFNIGGTTYNVAGKLELRFTSLAGCKADIRNIRTSQTINPSVAESYLVTRTASSAGSLTKEFTSYYGLYKSDLPNIYGNLYYSNGAPITQWKRFGNATLYPTLPDLLARELSNLFSKNYATLEADLGETFNSFGLIYLANTYTITDSSTNALSYNGKKFLMNRVTPNFYTNQNNNLQLLEITSDDNTSTVVSEWIVS